MTGPAGSSGVVGVTGSRIGGSSGSGSVSTGSEITGAGSAGTSATGSAGASATGSAGTSATGSAGASATGSAGTSATGSAGARRPARPGLRRPAPERAGPALREAPRPQGEPDPRRAPEARPGPAGSGCRCRRERRVRRGGAARRRCEGGVRRGGRWPALGGGPGGPSTLGVVGVMPVPIRSAVVGAHNRPLEACCPVRARSMRRSRRSNLRYVVKFLPDSVAICIEVRPHAAASRSWVASTRWRERGARPPPRHVDWSGTEPSCSGRRRRLPDRAQPASRTLPGATEVDVLQPSARTRAPPGAVREPEQGIRPVTPARTQARCGLELDGYTSRDRSSGGLEARREAGLHAFSGRSELRRALDERAPGRVTLAAPFVVPLGLDPAARWAPARRSRAWMSRPPRPPRRAPPPPRRSRRSLPARPERPSRRPAVGAAAGSRVSPPSTRSVSGSACSDTTAQDVGHPPRDRLERRSRHMARARALR